MNDPKHPVPGEMSVDATDIKVTDITPEQISKLTKVRDGFDTAVKTVINLKPEDVTRAGLSSDEITRLGAAYANDQRIGELLPAAEKMVELLHEARQLGRHDMGTMLAEMAAQVRRRSERVPNGPEVLGPVGELMDYQYGPGAKAAATKEKAKEAKKHPPGGTPPGGGTP
jgi:hypothetical protein